jgi:hypothetical protein
MVIVWLVVIQAGGPGWLPGGWGEIEIPELEKTDDEQAHGRR